MAVIFNKGFKVFRVFKGLNFFAKVGDGDGGLLYLFSFFREKRREMARIFSATATRPFVAARGYSLKPPSGALAR